MACLNMQISNEQQQGGGYLGPRISFSNDFGDTQQTATNMKISNTYKDAPVSSEFNFSVPCFTSNSADELFFKTKISPLKEKVVTLRDELLAAHDHDDDDDVFLPKTSGWWRFGTSQNHRQNQSQSLNLGPMKGDHKNHGVLETIDEANLCLRK